MTEIVKEVQSGKLSHVEAAEKIIAIREQMDIVIQHLRNKKGTL